MAYRLPHRGNLDTRPENHCQPGTRTNGRWPVMNAEFFALAFLAALNPKLLALDLLLIENRRPRPYGQRLLGRNAGFRASAF